MSIVAAIEAKWIVLKSHWFWLRLMPDKIGQELDSRIEGQRGAHMKNPLDSIAGTIISGLVLTIILYFFAKAFLPL
ncbi:MAG: hypothetical protein ACE5K1_01445 [Acidiferrobacterales bacterium]